LVDSGASEIPSDAQADNRRMVSCAKAAKKAGLAMPLQDMSTQSEIILPKQTLLSQYYPNMFNPKITIPYQLSEDAAGSYTVEWHAKDDSGLKVASGIYLYRLETNKTN
jgi:hypothetical protein